MYFRSNCSKSKWSSLHSRTLSHSCKSPGSSALKQYHAGFISAAPPAPILPFDIIVFVSTPFHDFAFLSHMELNVNFDVSIIPYGTIRYTLLSPWGDLVWTQVLSQQLPSLKYQKKKTIATDNNICNQRHKQVNQTAAYDAQFPYWEKRQLLLWSCFVDKCSWKVVSSQIRWSPVLFPVHFKAIHCPFVYVDPVTLFTYPETVKLQWVQCQSKVNLFSG